MGNRGIASKTATGETGRTLGSAVDAAVVGSDSPRDAGGGGGASPSSGKARPAKKKTLSPSEQIRQRIRDRFERDRRVRPLLPVGPNQLPVIAVLFGMAVPGLGHVFLGRWVKGVLIGGVLLGLFAYGLDLAWGCAFSEKAQELHQISYYLQHLIGLPALIASSGAPTPAEYPAVAFTNGRQLEQGMLFTCVAALLNVLVVIELFSRSYAVRNAKLGIKPAALTSTGAPTT